MPDPSLLLWIGSNVNNHKKISDAPSDDGHEL